MMNKTLNTNTIWILLPSNMHSYCFCRSTLLLLPGLIKLRLSLQKPFITVTTEIVQQGGCGLRGFQALSCWSQRGLSVCEVETNAHI